MTPPRDPRTPAAGEEGRPEGNEKSKDDNAAELALLVELTRQLENPTPPAVERSEVAEDDIPVVILMEEYGLDHFEDADDLERSRREVERLGRTAAGLDEEIETELELAKSLDFTVRHLRNFVTAAAGVGLPLLLWIGWPYYTSSLGDRPFHHLHEALRPSGSIGLSLGILGLSLMLASLVYLVRKKLVVLVGAASTARWLRFHIFTGLLGSMLAVFHASFLPTSAVGLLALGSVAVVLMSGLIGRYITAFVPKDLDGDEPALDEIRRRLVVYKRKLVKLGVSSAQIGIEAPGGARKRAPGVCLSLFRVLFGDRVHRSEYKKLRVTVQERVESVGSEATTLLVLVHRMCREHQWLIRYREMKRLVAAWRFLHRWLAIVLGAAVLLHLVVVFSPGALGGGGDR